jgi:hypothetical protein
MSSVKERFAALLESLLGTEDAIEASAALAFLDAMQPEDERITGADTIKDARFVMWYLTVELKSEAREVPTSSGGDARRTTTGAMRGCSSHACMPPFGPLAPWPSPTETQPD